MKPVVWQREDGVIAYHEQKEVDSQGFKWRPLYAAPRELSDEEIRQLDWNTTDMIAFARAILKKASEK